MEDGGRRRNCGSRYDPRNDSSGYMDRSKDIR